MRLVGAILAAGLIASAAIAEPRLAGAHGHPGGAHGVRQGWVLVPPPAERTGWVVVEPRARPRAMPVDAAPYASVVSHEIGALNLRAGPGTGYKVIGGLPPGERVKVLRTAGRWSHVKRRSGARGWVFSAYLRR